VADAKPYKLPLPRVGGYSAQFYKFCRDHELRFQRCADCGAWRHVPRDMCAKCGSSKWEWTRSSGKGKVPQFADKVPYSPAIIELEEGVRMVSWVSDVKPDEFQLGLPVEVVFDDVAPDCALPKFRRA
jgi:uncharacterized OB-fold protein